MKTLTLSGWTQPADALAKALPEEVAVFDYSEYVSPEASFSGLQDFAEVPYVIAWSMGGQLALRAIGEGILRPKHLTIIAAPYQFVAPYGMDPTTFTLFRENYVKDAARLKERFHGLIAKGDKDAKRVVALLEHHPEVENTERWLPWLDDLGLYSMHDARLEQLPPTLVVHGKNDAIVPYAQSLELLKKLPQAELSSWQGVGHAPHVHDANRLWREITEHRKKANV